MKNEINFGIGFVTGRANVCDIINTYYKNIIEQIQRDNRKITVTIYVLYDLTYQNLNREEFYNIKPEVYNSGIKIEYITPEDIEKEKEYVVENGILTKEQAITFFGYGHARGRNSLMYFALKQKIDYLLFWDDDEYPYAVEKKKIISLCGKNKIIFYNI